MEYSVLINKILLFILIFPVPMIIYTNYPLFYSSIPIPNYRCTNGRLGPALARARGGPRPYLPPGKIGLAYVSKRRPKLGPLGRFWAQLARKARPQIKGRASP